MNGTKCIFVFYSAFVYLLCFGDINHTLPHIVSLSKLFHLILCLKYGKEEILFHSCSKKNGISNKLYEM